MVGYGIADEVGIEDVVVGGPVGRRVVGGHRLNLSLDRVPSWSVIARSGQLASARRADTSRSPGNGIEQHDGIAVLVAAEHLGGGDCAHLMTMASCVIDRHSHRFFLSRACDLRCLHTYGCAEPS